MREPPPRSNKKRPPGIAPGSTPEATPGSTPETTPEIDTDPPTRDEWVGLLAAPDYPTRAEATTALLQDNTLDAQVLRAMLEDPSAAHPERRHRLLMIAEHHLMREIVEAWTAENIPADEHQKAAIGFSYDPILPANNPYSEHAAVMLLVTMPGFPGYAYLQPGDVVLAINDQTPRARTLQAVREWVRGTVGARRVGDQVRMTVQRGEDTLELVVPCSGIQSLSATYATSGQGNANRKPHAQQAFETAYLRLTDGLPYGPSVGSPRHARGRR